MKTFIYPYRSKSKSAKALAAGLECKRIKRKNSKFIPDDNKQIINWGSSSVPFSCNNIINRPEAVAVCCNKLSFFEIIRNYNLYLEEKIRIPPFTCEYDEAVRWIEENNWTVVARTTLTGHSGAGIIISNDASKLPEAPLYTKYIKKKQEYRIHFVGSTDNCFIQRKVRKFSCINPNWKIRNRKGGFAFANNPDNIGDIPEDVLVQAVRYWNSCNLDFCAIDIIWNEQQQKAYILEVNTAPGLSGKTLEFYINSFKLCV